ncbi:MAG TPA: alkaline phosphatase PhoX [Rubrobacter sp.]|nr:alkaline phosphatase PhoX [Rubrobacter sp.]
MATGPSIQRIKKEKRDREVEPPEGMSRRRFLTFLGTGSAALAAGSSGVLVGCAEGEEGGRQDGQQQENGSSGSAGSSGGQKAAASFGPIQPSDEDDIKLPDGFRYDIVRSSGDPLGGGMVYGDHNDYVAYFPVDALDGGEDSEDGLLWINHEYINPMFWSDYTDTDGETKKTKGQIDREKAGVGGSVVRVKKEGDAWKFVEGDAMNRRIDATTPMGVTGPAAGSDGIKGATEVTGTLANCGGGVTPWNTVLTCEENFQDYYGQRTDDQGEPGQGTDDAPEALEIAETYRWLDDPEGAQPPEHYGWIVEVDPFDPESKPRKHTWLGRVRHENAAITVSESGRVVVYTGHDQEDQCIYKFVSSGTYNEGDRGANMDLLTGGMLYVADFAQGKWVAMDYENNPIFKDNGYKDQGDVLVRTIDAAKLEDPETELPIGTPMDRCEDIEVHPKTGQIYASLTNNALHGNFYGQILRMTEKDDDAEAEEFRYELFAAGGPQTGFASPDNLVFDRDDNLWIITDISSSSIGSGIYSTFKNNGAFVLPSGLDEGAAGGDVVQFASAPVQAVLTGPAFTPDGKTLFLSVQHPGEESEDPKNPTSTWPNGDEPKSSVIAITGFA